MPGPSRPASAAAAPRAPVVKSTFNRGRSARARSASGPRHPARQDHIGEEQVHPLTRRSAEQAKRGRPVGRLQHPVAELPQHLRRIGAHLRAVLHDEHGFRMGACRHRGFAALLPALRDVAEYARQEEPHARPLAGPGADLHMPARLLDEAVDLAQAEAGALADLLGGEERLEHALHRLLVHADAGVGHGDGHVVARLGIGVAGGVGAVEPDVRGLDEQLPASRHRIARVHGEVEDGALELVGIRLRPP
jgi:hypothetical protein